MDIFYCFVSGWSPKLWKKYIEHAKMGHPRAAKEAMDGSIAAATKVTVGRETAYIFDKATETTTSIKCGTARYEYTSFKITVWRVRSAVQELQYRLNDARLKLKRIKTGSNLDTQHLRPLWDPSSLVSFITSTRYSTGMPDCERKDDKHALTINDIEYLSRWM